MLKLLELHNNKLIIGSKQIHKQLQACKGTMFFLPLPLSKTLEILSDVIEEKGSTILLPNPEIYKVINGKPTKN